MSLRGISVMTAVKKLGTNGSHSEPDQLRCFREHYVKDTWLCYLDVY